MCGFVPCLARRCPQQALLLGGAGPGAGTVRTAPERFTAARNELATALRGANPRASASVQSLRKPTIAAWLANRLVRIAPEQIAELTEFGDRLRDAHRTGDRASLKRLTPRRYELVNRLVDAAQADATVDGRTVTATAAEHLAATSTLHW